MVLRADPGMDVTSIRQLATDRAGQQLVTLAEDSTIRVWDALSGAPLKTVRLPELADGETVAAIALARDGKLLAAALRRERAGPTPEGDLIYLADLRAGRVLRRIEDGLPGIVQLAFSPDGTRLAVGLNANGVRLYEVGTGKPLGQDTDLQGPCSGLDFADDGRLAAASLDGVLCLYDANLKLLRHARLRSGLHSVRFSPDGMRLAVGYRGAPLVEVYSGEDLSSLYRPSIAGIDHGDLRLVAWSRGGSSLYAAGSWQDKAGPAIRRWSSGGQGSFEDLPAAEQPLAALLALPQESLAFAAQGPVWGLLGANGRPTQLHRRNVPAYQPGMLAVDRTGSRVRFAFVPPGAKDNSPLTAVFSVVGHALTVNPPADGSLSTTQAVNAPIPLPQGTVAAQASGDGRLVVAALADGTIRWYTAAEGRELLALLPHADGQRWVAWTQSGYYDASIGGDSLLGWQVTRGTKRFADFFPLGQFREHYFRPDVIARVLFLQDEQLAVTAANAEAGRAQEALPIKRLLPPVISLRDPIDGGRVNSSPINIRVAIRSPSGEPITQVRALVQGRLAQSRDARALVLLKQPTEELDPEATLYSLPVFIPPEDCTITVLVETALSRSQPAVLRLLWSGAQARQRPPLPDLYVLVVGTSRYRQAELRLEYPAKDAQDLAAALKAQEGKRYRRIELRVLTDEAATRANILEGLAWLRQKTTPQDVAVFFLAGHGINDPRDGKYYYLPYEAEVGAPADTMVDAGQIQTFLSNVHGKVLLFIDTCHSGSVLGPRHTSGGIDGSRLIAELASVESGVVVYAASTGGQVSRESFRWGNGAFTKAVVEGLRGKADYSRTGQITVSSLEHYVSNRVRELTQEEQTPTTAKPSTVPDFLIARVPPPRPLYKKPWFWGTVVGTVAAAGVALGVGLGVLLQDRSPALVFTFPSN
jgi:WD40 repeat protein